MLMQWTSLVSIGYHPEHTQRSQFLLAVKSAVELGVTVMVEVNMVPDQFDELEQLVDYIKNKYPSVHVTKTMRFHDPISNSKPLDYTPIQLVKLKRQHGDLQWDNGDFTNYQELLLEGRNKFKGWSCAAGTEQCVVDAWGRVYRGHCRQGGYLGKLSEEFAWSTLPIVCDVDQCANSFDIQATKTSGS
jgi:MoaA/NifB/PqqE/SkfB family radical SAM enzyme